MDREIEQRVRTRRSLKRWAVAGISFAAIAFLGAAGVEWLKPSVKRHEVQIARVERGSVDETLQASASAVPAGEEVVSSPVEARVLNIRRRAGDRVRAGDEILTLDTAASRLDLDRTIDRVAQKESEQTQLRLQLEETAALLKAQMEQKKLDVEILRYQAEQNRRLRAEGLIAEQTAMAAATSAKKSEIELAQLQEALARATRTAASKIAAGDLQLSVLRKERDASRQQLDLAMTRAPRDGILTWVVPEEGATVRRGEPVARIADLSSFRVVATISDIHASRIAAGMPVRFRLDDRTALAGSISSVDPRIENGAVRFYVALEQKSHPRLRNNLRGDVFVITGRRDNVLRVRRGALGQGAQEDVFVVRGEHAFRVPVRYGLAGEDTIEIAEGLVAGDEVVISNMSDFATVKQLRIR